MPSNTPAASSPLRPSPPPKRLPSQAVQPSSSSAKATVMPRAASSEGPKISKQARPSQ